MSLHALALVAAAQAALLVAGLVALAALHLGGARARRRADAADGVLEPLLHTWLAAPDDPGGRADAALVALVVALRAAPPRLALRFVLRAAAAHAPPGRRAALGRALRTEPWVARVLRRLTARRWWCRLEAARLLGVVVTPADAARVRALLADPVVAVQLAGADCLPRLANADLADGRCAPEVAPLADALLDALPGRGRSVGAYQVTVLAQLGAAVGGRVAERLAAACPAAADGAGAPWPDTPAAALAAWVDVAEALGDQPCLERVRHLAAHPAPEVRIRAARALHRLYSTECVDTLAACLADADWRVRAQAARSLGVLGARGTIPALAAAVGDRAWWVRYRAALALAQLGEPGRAALRTLRVQPDRMARDMGALVGGLSIGMITELAEV